MKAGSKPILIFACLLLFVGGWYFGSRFSPRPVSGMGGFPSDPNPITLDPRVPASDLLSVNQASRGRPNEESLEANRFDSTRPQSLNWMEATLRKIPFSVLKRIYLARQDDEFLRVSERYTLANESDEFGDTLFKEFQTTQRSSEFFIASGEWKLRGGQTLPFQASFRFYRDGVPENRGVRAEKLGERATDSTQVCWTASLIFKADEQRIPEYTSTCLPFTSMRSGVPFAVFHAYSKEAGALYDTLSVPLPGFGTEREQDPEWYDSPTGAWTALPKVRWEEVSSAEMKQAVEKAEGKNRE